MLLSFRISKEQKRALLFRYPSIKQFVEKAVEDTANKIIAGSSQFDIDKELKEYSDRFILNGCGPNRKRIMTQETKDKIRNALKGRYKGIPLLEETRLKMMGHIVSEETREKIRKATTGQKRSAEQRENISKAKIGQTYKKRAVKLIN